ncbi:hypothetical protein OLZ32_27785 [Rhizobium sp. 1AS11]|uniref:hypothetical protein n=1 Tax=Rhizobium acaciae TaxID=2989736 RepID=UPI002222B992|nr:hypothetical protein [Rhizobium acaciae]MCW1412154.1 hypothetical protein [Rhizobium acaciae]MCW1744169.1 hypothetical protein [Rhizobium acaciae]
MNNEGLRRRLEECQVGMATRGQLCNGEHLPPYLWEELRQRLQSIYRKATGETMATITVEHTP